MVQQKGISSQKEVFNNLLSTYLFILCVEVLSHMMNSALANKKIQGIKICNQGPMIKHLFFVDDSLFFMLANTKSCKAIKKILSDYEKISGQALNLIKSSITFGSKVNYDNKRRMRHILGIHNDAGGGKHLGLPKQVGRKKSEMFKYIIDKVKDRTQGWSKIFFI